VSERVCLDIYQGGTKRNRCTQICDLACTGILMNPNCTTKLGHPDLL